MLSRQAGVMSCIMSVTCMHACIASVAHNVRQAVLFCTLLCNYRLGLLYWMHNTKCTSAYSAMQNAVSFIQSCGGVLSAVLGSSQTLVQVVHQEGHREGVQAGLVAGACLGCTGLALLGLLLMLQVLVRPLCKDANHLSMHLRTTPHQGS